MKQGEIYLVDFDPSVGQEYRKIRPAVVVQSEQVSKISPYVTVMPISSQIDRIGRHDILVPNDHKNQLIRTSVIRSIQISSFDKARLIKRLGEVNSPILRRIRGYLREHFLL